jgi:tetratricopeptide (TPR) repeat protein
MPDTALEPPFEAYAGSEPFIFVSYAHKDAALVFPELKILHELGFCIWYDEGIDPGNEWRKAIAEALTRASMFLVFISPSAVASRNVNNEINLALDYDKGFLAVYIAETKLPAGLALGISSIQAVKKYKMRERSYRQEMGKAIRAILKDGAVHTASTVPTESPEEIVGLYNRAMALIAKGDYAGADPLLRRVLAGRERIFGMEHLDTLNASHELANSLYSKEDYAGAEPFYRRALEGIERANNPDSQNTLNHVNSLARCLYWKGDYAGAETFFRRLLAGRERLLGSEHPETLIAVNDVAKSLTRKGDLGTAGTFYRRLLTARERLLGPEHPDTVRAARCLASCETVKNLTSPSPANHGRRPPAMSARLATAVQQSQIEKLIADPPPPVYPPPIPANRMAAAAALRFPAGAGDGYFSEDLVNSYREDAFQGFADAQYQLGGCYLHGRGVSTDAVEAVRWFRKAAEQGNDSAEFALGLCYLHGNGVAKNEAEAVKLFRHCADRGDPASQKLLGDCYLAGTGVRKNEAEATKWFRKAAGQGDTEARKSLQKIPLLKRIRLFSRGRE